MIIQRVECQEAWASRFAKANEAHLELGSRGINAFQASGLKSYEYATLSAMPVHTAA